MIPRIMIERDTNDMIEISECLVTFDLNAAPKPFPILQSNLEYIHFLHTSSQKILSLVYTSIVATIYPADKKDFRF